MSHNHYEDYHGHGNGDGHHGHNHHDHSHIPQIPTLPSQSLYTKIDLSRVSGLNLANRNDSLSGLFKNSETKYQIRPVFQTDLDNQLILNIPFTDNIKLYSIILRTNGNADHCPKNIKFFKNNDSIDFNNVNDIHSNHHCEHPLVGYFENVEYEASNDLVNGRTQLEIREDSTFVEHHLPRHVFNNVNFLTIYFQNNWSNDDEEYLQLYSIEFRGEWSPLSKSHIITNYESAANPADHKNLLKQENKNYSEL
ncbi:hypothetical protein PACTADRAFT_3226 [Pachysolen tannophilus NRRL Y-2460]|uniref:PITH domain-containing protein n=1 Tax=Pachysolen tannophilus NRRL Y-2460 TaxID=669874 RepID=A0A1E4TV45_PACTA|nr:hypothetical protein PACTADRAFT_3226 [Pachysolen tannophilus NRRL Y-2460]